MEITIVFTRDSEDTVFLDVDKHMSIQQIDNLVRLNFSGVAYWAIGVNA